MNMMENVQINRKFYRTDEFKEDFLLPPKAEVPISLRLRKKVISTLTCSKIKAKKVALELFPFLSLLDWYDWKHDFVSDVIAGLTVGIMQIPQGMAYAVLAGLPPVIGLYISFFPVLVYFFFGTSRQLSMGAIAVVSLMVGGVVEREAASLTTETTGNFSDVIGSSNGTDPGSFDDVTMKKIQVATTLCFIVGAFQAIMGLCRLGLVTTYMSEPLVKGFTCGAAVHVGTSQVKYMLGLKIRRFSGILQIPYTYIEIFRNIHLTNIAELVISLVCIVVLYLVKAQINQRFKKKLRIPIPIDLFVLIIATVASTFGYFRENYGIRVVGHIPAGMPPPQIPTLHGASHYLGDCIGITVIAFGQAVSLAVLLGKKHNYSMDSSKELFAYGMSNLFGAFFWCYPASAAVSRTSVSDSAGSRSQIYSLFSCVLLLIVILVIGPLFKELPNCVLSAIVVVALRTMLLQILDLRMYWRICKVDCMVWIVTFLSVVILHVDLGLALGIGFSVFTVVVRSQCARATVVESVPCTELYRDGATYQTRKSPPGICIIQYDAPLYYANGQMFQNRVYRATGASPGMLKKQRTSLKSKGDDGKHLPQSSGSNDNSYSIQPLKYIIIDLSASHFTDFVGAKTLKQVCDDYSSVDVTVYLTGVTDEVYKVLKAAGFLDTYGANLYLTVQDAVVAAGGWPDKDGVLSDGDQNHSQLIVILECLTHLVTHPGVYRYAEFYREMMFRWLCPNCRRHKRR